MTYYDAQGQRVTLDALCRSEPKWAAARIRSLTSELAGSKAREEMLRKALGDEREKVRRTVSKAMARYPVSGSIALRAIGALDDPLVDTEAPEVGK